MESLRATMQKSAMSLFHACRRHHPQGNLLYSPLSALAGVFLILVGSEGKTRYEIEDALKFFHSPSFNSSKFEEDMKLAFRYILAIIGRVKEDDSEAISSGAFRVFRMNRLYVKDDIVIRPLFQEEAAKLKFELESICFKKDAESARQKINEYVEQRMNGKIRDCFQPETIDRETKMILVNGMCFSARWEYPFPKENTRMGKFHELHGVTVDVEMMRVTAKLQYAREENINVIFLEIPYVGNVVSMLIFLPIKALELRDVGQMLDPSVLNKLHLMKRIREVDIHMPKFSMQTRLDMKDLLQTMHVNCLFGDMADFGKMTRDDRAIPLSAAVHTSYFNVDENGTGMKGPVDLNRKVHIIENHSHSLSVKVGGKSEPLHVTIEHPFLFAIRHNKSATMLCLGRVETIQNE